MGMVHTFTRGLLAVAVTSLVSSFAMGQTGSSSSPTAGKTGAATAPAAEADAANDKAFNTLAQETSIKRSINKHGNVVEEATVSANDKDAMERALAAVVKQRFGLAGTELSIVEATLPSEMTLVARADGQDFILNPAEKSEKGPNKEITVYYPLTDFSLTIRMREVTAADASVGKYLDNRNLVLDGKTVPSSEIAGEGLQLGLLMKSVSRADLSDDEKLRKFFRREENGRVWGFSAVDTVPVQQFTRKEGSGVLGTNSHMVTSNLADFANFVQTSMPKHFATTGPRSTVGLDHAIWGSAAKAIAVKTLMVQDPSLEAAAAKKIVEERFVGYVLSEAIPEEALTSLPTFASDRAKERYSLNVGPLFSADREASNAKLKSRPGTKLYVVLK